LRPNKPSPQKHIVYESGVDPVGSGWGSFGVCDWLLLASWSYQEGKHQER